MRNIKGLSILLLIIFISSCKTSQKNSTPEENTALLAIGSENVYPEEFLYAYEKSNKNKGQTEPFDDYLDLYIGFKLKVIEAKALGLDTAQSYVNELNGYLEEIKKPYITTEKANKELVQEAYERLQHEINASHILITVAEDAKPEDTLKAYQKIEEVQKRFEAGESFESLARKYSDDPSAVSNNGLLGWFTAFQMVYPFESAAYETQTGEISQIIRTQFGYHLIKINDKRETLGRIKIAHIMKRFPLKATAEDSASTEVKIRSIYQRIHAGENWFTLATNESDDLNTKDQGGSLPWYGAGNLPPALETAAFELENKGDISQPIKSPFGWHILKLEDKRGVGSLSSMEESLSRRVQRDQRSELRIPEVIMKLKQENNFRKNENAYKVLASKKELKEESFKKKELAMTLFQISKYAYSVQDFLNILDSSKTLESNLANYEKEQLIAYEENHLEEKYPDYKYLRKEYKEGLLLFEIMNQEIWSKAGRNTHALAEYYNNNKAQYMTPAQMKIARIIFSDTSSIKAFNKPIKNTFFPLSEQLTFKVGEKKLKDKIKVQLTEEDTVYIKLSVPKNIKTVDSLTLLNELNLAFKNMEVTNLTYSNENKIYLQLLSKANSLLTINHASIDSANTETVVLKKEGNKVSATVGECKRSMNNNGLIEVNYSIEEYPPRQMTFEEARAKIAEDYQNYLEEEWVKELKQKYKISVNDKIAQKIKLEIEK